MRPDHLFAGSRSDNMVDASRKGRLGKLVAVDYETIKSIVREHRSGTPQTALAARFSLTKGVVWNLVKGKTLLGARAVAEIDGKALHHMRALKRVAKGDAQRGPTLDEIRQWLAKRRGDVG